jgi:glucose-1-phosphate adenylyltransferase
MNDTQIGSDCELNKAIVAENVVVQDRVRLGIGDEVPNETHPHIYNNGLVCIGEKSFLPEGLTVGKNACIFGITDIDDYDDLQLASGKTLIKAGDEQ